MVSVLLADRWQMHSIDCKTDILRNGDNDGTTLKCCYPEKTHREAVAHYGYK